MTTEQARAISRATSREHYRRQAEDRRNTEAALAKVFTTEHHDDTGTKREGDNA